jgi:flavin reductase (DIM6/NTAB) family NADH-FMN oxidoreductase RutF
MSLHAFNAGCNILAFEKEHKKYGMCCAWAQMIGYSEISMLIGDQSITGHMLSAGDIVGVSALAINQEPIASLFGNFHSNEYDKFKDLKFTIKEGAILINDAKTMMKCQVTKILNLEEAPADYFVIMKVLNYQEDKSKEFLSAYSEKIK